MIKQDLYTVAPVDILARCLFGEARGVKKVEQIAVGCVMRNRTDWFKGQGGKDYMTVWHRVVLTPYQFSSFNTNDHNLAIVLDPVKHSKSAWLECIDTAMDIITGRIADVTGSADHYHDKTMDGAEPSWAKKMTLTYKTDNFRFYRSDRK